MTHSVQRLEVLMVLHSGLVHAGLLAGALGLHEVGKWVELLGPWVYMR